MSKMNWNKVSQASTAHRRHRQWERDERERMERMARLALYEQQRLTMQPEIKPVAKPKKRSRPSFEELLKRYKGK